MGGRRVYPKIRYWYSTLPPVKELRLDGIKTTPKPPVEYPVVVQAATESPESGGAIGIPHYQLSNHRIVENADLYLEY